MIPLFETNKKGFLDDSYITLNGLPELPEGMLNSLEALTFTYFDNPLHNLENSYNNINNFPLDNHEIIRGPNLVKKEFKEGSISNDASLNIIINNSTFTEVRIGEKKQMFIIDNHRLGRKRKGEKYERKHNKCFKDNIINKIHNHFINFIVKFVNAALKKLQYKENFRNIKYDFKKILNSKNFEELKKKSIGYILNQEISSKFLKIKKNYNKNLYEKIKNDSIIKDILSYNYKDFFSKIFCRETNIISLKEFGSKKDDYIDLIENKCEAYKVFLQKFSHEQEYIKLLDEYKKLFINK